MKCLDMIRDALLTVTDNVDHYEAFKKTDRYIVWEEYAAESFYADDKHGARAFFVAVNYFTKQQNDPNRKKIEMALDSIDAAWNLNSIQYEPDTGYTHYEWVCEVEELGEDDV